MEPIEERISKFLAACNAATCRLNRSRTSPVTSRDVETALTDVLQLEQSVDLLREPWTEDRIVQLLASYDFRRLHPETVRDVTLDVDIIPDGVLRLLTEERIKNRGHVWHIHKNDADPFPSNPHAHNYATGHTLHLGTGDLYIRRRCVGRIRRKHLELIRSRSRHGSLPLLEV